MFQTKLLSNLMIRMLSFRISTLSSVHVSLASILRRSFRTYGRSSILVDDRGCHGFSSNLRSHNGIRAFCTGQDLSIKRCVPCNLKDLRPMTEDAANILIQQIPGWNLTNEGGTWKLNRSWKVKTFVKGMEFLGLVADVAEAEGHHPDLHLVGWNNIKIDIWTHAVGGLTENDFILAAKISGLNLHHLLRITPAKC